MTSDTNRQQSSRPSRPLELPVRKVRGGGAELDRLVDKFVKGETQREATAANAVLDTSSAASRRQRQSNTQQAAFSITAAETSGGGTVWGDETRREGGKKKKSWLRVFSLSRQTAGSPVAAPPTASLLAAFGRLDLRVLLPSSASL